MAATHRWKVYTRNGSYEASVSEPTLGAMIISGASMGTGATIRDGHNHVCWIEGVDGDAGESYDEVAETCWRRANTGKHYSVGVAAGMAAREILMADR